MRHINERYGGSKRDRSIWFHGTSIDNLRKIVKQGLVANPKNKNWDSDPDASFDRADRTSFGGVYLTQNILTAYGASNRPGKELKNQKVIVVIELQPKSLVLDEDDLQYELVVVPTPGAARNELTTLWVYMAWKYGDKKAQSWVKESQEKYAESIFQSLKRTFKEDIHPKLKKRVEELLLECWEKAVTRSAAYFPKSRERWEWDWKRVYRDYTDDEEENAPKPPDLQKSEKAFRACVDKLTRTLKSAARPFLTSETLLRRNGRLLQDIGFRGSNKIVAIVVAGREDKARFGPVKVVYGKLPPEFKIEWEKRIGDLEIVETANTFGRLRSLISG